MATHWRRSVQAALWSLVFILPATSAIARDGYRYWKTQPGKSIGWERKLIEVKDGLVTLEREEERTLEKFPLADFADEEQRILKLWMNEATRSAVQRALDLGNLSIHENGDVELIAIDGSVSDDDLRAWVKAFPNLTELNLPSCNITREGLQSLVPLKKLRTLDIPASLRKSGGVTNIEINLNQRRPREAPVVDPGLDIVAQIATLESLRIAGNGSLSIGQHFSALEKSKLKRLELSMCRLTADDLQRIAKISTLEEFKPEISPITTDVQPPLLKHLVGLKKLRAIHLDVILTDDDAEQLAHFPELRELHIAGWTPAGFRAVADMKNLHTLAVFDPSEPTMRDADFAVIAKQKQLKKLWLWSPTLTDQGLQPLAGLTELEELYLPQSVTPVVMKHLEKLNKLTFLGFDDDINERKNPVCLSHALHLLIDQHGRKLPDALRILDPSTPATGELRLLPGRPPLDAASGKYLGDLELELLSFYKAPLDDWLKEFGSCRRVRELTLNGNRSGMSGNEETKLNLSVAGLRHLQGWEQLERLHILQCTLAPSALEPLKKAPRLKDLSLNFCQVADGNFEVLAALRSLEKLDLNGPSFEEEHLAALTGLTELRELSFTKPVSLEALRKLKGLKKLEKLEIPCNHLPFDELWKLVTEDFGREPAAAARMIFDTREDEQGRIVEVNLGQNLQRAPEDARNQANAERTLLVLKYLPHLRKLELPPGISNEALRHLVHTPDLKWLEIDSAEIDDRGLVHLRHLHQLDRLNSSHASFTDEGLKELLRLPKIKNLFLWRTKISKETAKQMQEKHPDISLNVH